MKHFTNEAIKTAKERTFKLIIKLGSMHPDDNLTKEDIDSIMFYLRDYNDELESLEYSRKLKKLNREA